MKEYKVKILLAGTGASGKTAYLKKLLDNQFKKEYEMTMAGEIKLKQIKYDEDTNIQIILHDLPGEERFQPARLSLIGGSDGALVFFDLTRYPSFNPGLPNRIKEIWYNLKKRIPIVVVGTKKDMDLYRSIRPIPNEASKYCDKIPCKYFEISAKTGENIEKPLKALLDEIISRKREAEND
ncbi:MAG: Rab family GTPase [Candidatus Helarchaeota archaeon]